MKKLFNILLPFALLSFSSVIHAEDDASGIVVSQTISNTPDANGQYTVTIEAYVKGESTKLDPPEYVPVEVSGKTILQILNKNSESDLIGWIDVSPVNINVTASGGGSETYKGANTGLIYKKSDSGRYDMYVGYIKPSSTTYKFAFFYKSSSSWNRICSAVKSSEVPTIPKPVEKKIDKKWESMYSLLGTSSTISETFDGFFIPSGATITKLTADCNGESSGTPTFSTQPNSASATVTTSSNGNTINITGFDFSTNACGSDGSDNHGKKLIVTFPVATTVSNTGGSAKTVVNTVTVTNQSRQQVTGFTSSTATVNLPNLYIQASGVNDNENCLFTVTGTSGSWNKTFTVMTTGSTAVKLQAMPEGTYTITPKSWPWAYNLPEAQQNVSLTGNGTTLSFTFTPNSITTPHHGEATASTPAN